MLSPTLIEIRAFIPNTCQDVVYVNFRTFYALLITASDDEDVPVCITAHFGVLSRSRNLSQLNYLNRRVINIFAFIKKVVRDGHFP